MPILGTPTQVTGGSGSYAPESGSNRIVVFSLSGGTTDTGSSINPTISAFTYGSASLANGQVIVANQAGVGSGANVRAWLAYVKEANLPGSAQTPTATWSNAMVGSDLIMCFTLGSIDQTTSVDGAGTTEIHASGTDPWTGSLTISNNCIQILTHGYRGGGNASSPGAGWTEVQDVGNSTMRAVTQYATGQAAGSLTYTSDLASAVTGALAVASFAEATAAIWTQSRHPARQSTLVRM